MVRNMRESSCKPREAVFSLLLQFLPRGEEQLVAYKTMHGRDGMQRKTVVMQRLNVMDCSV